MAINRQKISQMTPKGSALGSTDLIEVSVNTGSGYETRSITGQEIIDGAGGAFVPYTGATADVDLGTFHLDAGKGTFSHNGSTDTLTANHTSGAGIGLLITKGGNNEGLKVNKTSGSGNAATIIGTLEATTLVKTGGLATEFLMADGSTSTGTGGSNILDQTNGASSIGTTQTISKSIALPSVPNTLKFRASTFRTSGTFLQFTTRVYLSDINNNIGGTAVQIATITSFNTASNYTRIARNGFDIISGNIIGMNGTVNSPSDDVNQTSARLNSAIPTGTPLYLIFSVQCNSALDSVRVESVEISNF
jgi:hypothetical protein